MRAEWADLHHGKYSDPLCHYVAEAHDGSIVGDAQVYEASDVDVDYWARIGKRRIYHVDSQGFHYLWRHPTEAEADRVFASDVEHLRPESERAVTALSDDGDTFDLEGGRTLRLRQVPDDMNPFEEFDTYGKIAPVAGRRNDYGHHERPEEFDGGAEKLWPPQNGEPVWWQPPADVKRTDPSFDALRTIVKDLVAFGTHGLVVELLDGEDAYHQPIVRRTASLWGLEPFMEADYKRTVIGELVDEVLTEEA